MSLIDIIFRRKNIENPAKINLKNIWKFIQGNYFKLILKVPVIGSALVRKSRIEQIAWRREQVALKSPDCYKSKICYCGCDVEGLIAADEACLQKNLCFPVMMTAEEWNKYKIENKI